MYPTLKDHQEVAALFPCASARMFESVWDVKEFEGVQKITFQEGLWTVEANILKDRKMHKVKGTGPTLEDAIQNLESRS
jgi:hypothetical protein